MKPETIYPCKKPVNALVLQLVRNLRKLDYRGSLCNKRPDEHSGFELTLKALTYARQFS